MRPKIFDFFFRLYPTNEDIVSKNKTNFAKKHSSGAAAVSNIILKLISHDVTRILVKRTNFSLVTGVFAEKLAVAEGFPLGKKIKGGVN